MVDIGQIPHRADLQSVSLADPCVITTIGAHGYHSFDFVRLTNLNGCMPSPHGVNPLDGNKYRIIVLSDQTFKIQNPITFADIDSTNYSPYTTGGFANLVTKDYFFHGENDG